MKIKVVPRKSRMKAPYYVIDVDNKLKNPISTAENIAKSMSRLGQLDWLFWGEKIY